MRNPCSPTTTNSAPYNCCTWSCSLLSPPFQPVPFQLNQLHPHRVDHSLPHFPCSTTTRIHCLFTNPIFSFVQSCTFWFLESADFGCELKGTENRFFKICTEMEKNCEEAVFCFCFYPRKLELKSRRSLLRAQTQKGKQPKIRQTQNYGRQMPVAEGTRSLFAGFCTS